MKQPIVSIIIPAYNAEEYIKEAVESALAQTYANCEVVVVDDGSTDNTRNVLAPYLRAKKIIYIHQSNKGLAGARNTGVRKAKGGYIAFLDSDDIFLPEKIGKQVEILVEHPDFGVCYSDLMHFTGGSPRRFFHHRYTYPSGDIFAPLLKKQFINPLTVMARRELFETYGYFDEALRRSEDWDLWLRWARAGIKFYYLDKVLAHSRIRSTGNLSAIKSEPEMKEKNLFIFTRLGVTLTNEEYARYRFAGILRGLTMKTAFAYLMMGDKRAALQRIRSFPFFAFLVALLPASVWKRALGAARRLKHRLLFRRMA
jgi:glycosyltransferase involved in cell wall biosynthesis